MRCCRGAVSVWRTLDEGVGDMLITFSCFVIFPRSLEKLLVVYVYQDASQYHI